MTENKKAVNKTENVDKPEDKLVDDLQVVPETVDAEPKALAGAAITMGRFRATGPGILGARQNRPATLPINRQTDSLVAKGLLERVE